MTRRTARDRKCGKNPASSGNYCLVIALLLATPLLCIRAAPVFALGELPLISEDPTSPCASTLDAASAYSLDLVGPGHDQLGQQEFRSHLDMSVPIVQLNYGITDRIQGRVAGEIPITTVAPDNGKLTAGFGDMSAGIKYRFMDQRGGLEYTDDCDPRQSEAAYGLVGPVSLSLFPQFTFPTGSVNRGLGSGEYSMEIPADVAREFGNLYVVGEGDFLWQYHDRSSPNQFALGVAAYYSLTPDWDLLGEQRVEIPTAGYGSTVWLMNIGSEYQVNDYFAVFGAFGTSAAASSNVAASNFAMVVGTDLTIPIDW
ncbi:MAG: hypothetical protein ACREQ4_08525 [Candidatus Binataceae bacterium]